MGLFSRSAPLVQAAQAMAPGRRVAVSPPWASGNTLGLISADVFGAVGELLPVTRAEAMTVPGVVAARNEVCGALAQGVLKAYRGEAEVTTPAWCYRTDSDVPPALRLWWTVDDLMFGGYALWEVARGAGDRIVDAVRVPPERWSIDADCRVLIDDDEVQARDVVLFTGWDEGLLTTAASYIRGARELHKAVRQRVRVPVPHTVLKGTDKDSELTPAETTELVESFVAARRDVNGAVSYIPAGVDLDTMQGADIALFEQGRNAEVLDLARFTGVPAALLEATGVSASLTYETKQTARSIFNERMRRRALLIEARLSMDDVCPKGQRIALDLSHLQDDGTGLPAATED